MSSRLIAVEDVLDLNTLRVREAINNTLMTVMQTSCRLFFLLIANKKVSKCSPNLHHALENTIP